MKHGQAVSGRAPQGPPAGEEERPAATGDLPSLFKVEVQKANLENAEQAQEPPQASPEPEPAAPVTLGGHSFPVSRDTLIWFSLRQLSDTRFNLSPVLPVYGSSTERFYL